MIRNATDADAPRLAEIYNHYVLHNSCTFETESLDAGEMRIRVGRVQASGDPWLVLEEQGKVWGYAYAHPFRERRAYRYTCEGSVYCCREGLGMQLGERLLQGLIQRLREDGRYYTLIGVIAGDNEASIRLCQKLGFHFGGRLPRVGRKNGQWLDTVNYYYPLREYERIDD